MPSDLAVSVRDRLNGMVDELIADTEDQESNVLACCISLAVEEVEKWMYKGEFTPSVAPFREGIEWHMPEPEPEPEPAKVPWSWPDPSDRLKRPKMAEMTALDRVKKKAAKEKVIVRTPSVFDAVNPTDWDAQTMLAFRDGNRPAFIACMISSVPGMKISLKEASDYTNRMVVEFPSLWGADKK